MNNNFDPVLLDIDPSADGEVLIHGNDFLSKRVFNLMAEGKKIRFYVSKFEVVEREG